MVKRVFAIIGIVLGAVTAFAGAVFGVMALMGKFKTPKVYPTELYFEYEEITEVERIPYNSDVDITTLPNDKLPTRYSFTLIGKNSDEKEPVNQRECYLLIKDSNTEKLITLCDSNRVPLKADNKNRYLVNCNSEIYYMINEVVDDKGNVVEGVVADAQAVLYARSTNDTLKAPEKPLKINIDRIVDNVSVLGGEELKIENNQYTQFVQRTISQTLTFDYAVETELAYKPISSVSAKAVELYYDAKGTTTDYVKVTQATVNDPTSPLYSILKYENNKFVFASSSPGDYTFYIAIFPTYENEINYNKGIENLSLESPNYHKVNSDLILTTKLTIQVANIEITEVGFNKDSVALELYSQKDYITLDKDNVIQDAQNNNLGLYMKRGGDFDTTRLDEVNMDGFDGLVWEGENANIVFTNVESYIGNGTISVQGEIGNQTIKLTHETTKEEETFKIKLSNIALSENWFVVDCLEDTKGDEYYSSNGAVVLDATTKSLKLLRSGSYLNFYVKTTDGQPAETSYSILKDEFDYEAKLETSKFGKEKSWQIISKNLPNINSSTQSLQLGILVVNNTGKFIVDNYFKTINVSVSKVDWDYTTPTNVNLSVNFNDSGADYLNAQKLFSEIVTTVNAGSFNAGVLMVKESDKEKVINLPFSIQFDGETYYVVGYRNESNKFVNAIVPTEEVKNREKYDLFMLQFKNSYDETVEDIIEKYFPETYEEEIVAKEFVVETDNILEIDQTGTTVKKVSELSVNYVLNDDGLVVECLKGESTPEIEYKDDAYNLYENTGYYYIYISSDKEGMIKTLFDFYSTEIVINEIGSEVLEENIDIYGVYYDSAENTIVIMFSVKESLFNPNTKIEFELVGLGGAITLPSIRILDGSPDNIVFNSKENAQPGEQIVLSDTDDVNQNGNYIKLLVSYNNDYELKYSLISGATETPLNETIFNNAISAPSDFGFQGAENKGQTYLVNYSSLTADIFRITYSGEGTGRTINTQISGFGTVVIKVQINGTIKYLRLEVVAGGEGFKLDTVSSKTTEEETYLLSEDAKFYYNNDKNNLIDLATKNLITISNVRINSYGDGELIPDDTGLIFTDASEKTILAISDNAENGWQFEKANVHIPLQITFTINSIVGSREMTLIFESSISVSVNKGWNKSRVLYEDTKVNLSGTNGIFSVSSKSGGGTFSFKINGVKMVGETYTVGNTYGKNNIIVVEYRDTQVDSFKFEIKPNIVATQKTGDLKTETGYKISKLYTLQQFKTGSTYGAIHYLDKTYYKDDSYSEISDEETEFWKYTHLTDFNGTGSLEIQPDTKTNPTIDWNSTEENKLYIGTMTELGTTVQRDIMLKYNGYDVLTSVIDISNKHEVLHSLGAGTNCEEYGKQIFKAMKDYTHFVGVAGFTIDKIEANNLSFGEEPYEKFRIATPVFDDLTEVEVIFTFKLANGSQTLTYKTLITILPYTPTENKNVEAYSGSEFDLLKEFYVVQYDSNAANYPSSINADVNIKKLFVTGILDEKGNDITSEIINGTFVSNGYTEGVPGANCLVNLMEIVGESKQVYVQFTVTYKGEGINNKEYTFELPLTINNRQSLESTYAEAGLGGDANTLIFNFNSAYTEEALELSGQTEANASGMYQVKITEYEPICVVDGKKIVLDLVNSDNNKKVIRAIAKNENGMNNNLDLKVELIAYENQRALYQNISKISTVKNQIILDFTSGMVGSGFFGTLIFKVSTESGNYIYYNIYLYSKSSLINIDVENSLDVVAYSTDSYAYSSDVNLIKVGISAGTSYRGLIAGIDSSKFSSAFGRDFDVNTKLYLYNGVATGRVFDYNGKQWQEIKDTDTISTNAYFNTITIGLLYYNGLERYVYGTINLYIQPNNDVNHNVSLRYDAPNGEFKKELFATETSILNPFTGWTANVESISNNDGLNIEFVDSQTILYESEQIEYGSATSINVDGKEIEFIDADNNSQFEKIKIDGEEVVDTNIINEYITKLKIVKYYLNNEFMEIGTGGNIILKYRVTNETYIRVKYKTGNTIAFVNYTYLKTEIPTVEELTAKQFTVGEWKESDFAKTVDLTEKTIVIDAQDSSKNISPYLGTYGGEIQITGTAPGTNSYTPDLTNKKIEFAQTTEQWQVTLTITYLNLEGKPSRDFLFVVKPGVYLDTTAYGASSTSGLTEGKRCETVVQEINTYETVVGSTLTVKNTSSTKWEIAGLIIHTNKASKLKLTFSDGLYVLKDEESVINVSTGEENVINFPHLAQATSLNVKVEVLNESNELYATRNLYLTVARTYESVQVKYLTEQDNNPHENITNGKLINNLHDKFTNTTSPKLTLKDLNGNKVENNFDLQEMGFNNETNPNYLEFSCSANGTPKYTGLNVTGIQFATVSKNTFCNVGITNKAGIGNLAYTYQIVVSEDYEDGLDYTATSGIYESITNNQPDYLSFMMDDVIKDGEEDKGFSSTYVIGKMLDVQNQTAFSVTSAMVGEASGNSLETKLDTVDLGENSVAWRFGNAGYIFTVYLDKTDSKIKLDVLRTAGEVIDNQTLNLSLGGVNGVETIAKGLEIYLSKDSVALRDVGTQYYTANHTVDLKTEFAENDSKPEEKDGVKTYPTLGLTYELAESSYNADGKVYTIAPGGNSNLLFDYDSDTKKMLLRSVGETVSATINFKVRNGTFLIGSITLKLSIGLNLQVVANGETLDLNIGNRNLETNFVIDQTLDEETTDSVKEQFPIIIYFSHVDTFNKSYNYSNGCYNKLVYDLYFLSKEGIANPTDNQLRTGYGNINISTYDGTNSGVGWTLAKDNSGEYYFKFTKDFSGDIVLVLEVKASVGTYVVDWTIHVQPVLNVQYANVGAETIKLKNSSMSFNSGANVSLIARAKGSDVGITMQPPTAFNKDNKKEVVYNYKIIKKDEMTEVSKNSALYELTSDSEYFVDEVEEPTKYFEENEYSLSVILPVVPGTSLTEGKSYYVVYQIIISYLNHKEIYYVTYDVVNYQSVETYVYKGENSSDEVFQSSVVNVSKLTENKLDLFYFKQIFTTEDGNTTYEFTYEDEQLKMGTSAGSNNGDNKWEFGELTLDLSGSVSKLLDSSGNEIAGTWSFEKGRELDNKPVFESQFSNIREYITFINQYVGEQKCVQIKDDKVKAEFHLIYNDSSKAYGIDLKEEGAYTGKLFNNTMDAQLSLMNGSIPLVVVPAYTEASQTGFRLHADITLTPKSSLANTLDSMFLDSYLAEIDENLRSVPIIGVGATPQYSWVNNAEDDGVSLVTDIGIIKIPNAVEYSLKMATWTGDGGGDYYTISEQFYYIAKDVVYLPNYSAVSIETDHFRVSYPNNISKRDDKISLNLSNAVKEWKMVEDVLTPTSVAATVKADSVDSTNFELEANLLKVEASVLIDYKISNPEKYMYTTTITITNGGADMTCNVVFVLPTQEQADKLKAPDA